MSKRPFLPKLAELFDLGEDYLISPDAQRLRPALVSGSLRGESVLVKYWEKTGSPVDKDLGHIWRREMRLAERIRVRPRGDELLVPVLETGEAGDAFYLVIPGDWRPLAARRKTAKQGHWLQGLRTPAQRVLLWRNVARIADALDLVHAQRIVHGDVGDWAIFTANDYEPDFRLGGFEWCVRIGEPVALPQQGRIYSFVEDWRELGALVEDLLRPVVDAGGADAGLSHHELSLIEALKGPATERHFDRRRLRELLTAVERDCAADKWGQELVYILGARLDRTPLARVIGEATDFVIGADNPEGQRRFISDDLAVGAELVRLGDGVVWALGEALAYKLSPAGDSAAPWRGCVVEVAQSRNRLPLGRAETRPLPVAAVEIVRGANVGQRIGALGARAGDWSKLLGNAGDGEDADEDVRLGLTLTEVVLALFGAAEVLPVELVEQRQGMVYLRAASDETVDGLHKALKVKQTHLQMRDIFELEEGDVDAEWALRERPVLGAGGEGAGKVTFSHVEEENGQRFYAFHLSGSLPPTSFPFLMKTGEGRPQGVVHRRLKLLSALAGQRELSQTLLRPESTMRSQSRRALSVDKAFDRLDPSKQAALQTIWRHTPLQAVVGPPGVGKTLLLSEFVRRNLEDDEDRSFLVTSQGHQALDNAGEGICSALGKDAGELIVVRSRNERGKGDTSLYASRHVENYLKSVTESDLFKRAPTDHREALEEMYAAARGHRVTAGSQANRSREVRAMETVTMQAATILLSTTNSGDLAALVENGTIFDEVIVEEAAKATGPELLAPMLLAMQRLLIGDHNQLPAFDSDRLVDLLGDVSRVRAAVRDIESMLGAAFRDYGLEELLDVARDDARLTRACDRAREMVRLFETIIRRDGEREVRFPESPRIAVQLNEQHRMHPTICEVVSHAFYERKLETSDEAEKRFASGKPPFLYDGNVLPLSPIVWIDLPYVQCEEGAHEEAPAHHNPAERSAVLAVLDRVRATAQGRKKPTLAVLSPYQQQAERLVRDISQARPRRLAHLDGFRSPSQSGLLAGTVDSFQGSEADLVIVSLVRNNRRSGSAALGFLNKAHRMNVLLSRAKWQLVLVGSLQFMQTHARRYGGGASPVSGCMPVLMDIFSRLMKERLSDGTPKMSVVPVAKLTGAAR